MSRVGFWAGGTVLFFYQVEGKKVWGGANALGSSPPNLCCLC